MDHNINFEITPEQAHQLCDYYEVTGLDEYEICELLDRLIDDITS